MKNYAIILAGGIGSRMKMNIPKQFIEVKNKPIIVYTLEAFQKSNYIDKIVVVCLKNWIDYLKKLIDKYSLSKVEWIVESGDTGHDSIRNGVFFLKDKIKKDDFIVVHDAVRPFLPQNVLNSVIQIAHEKGNASAAISCHPPIVYTDDYESGIEDVDRDHVMLASSPQAYKYSLALNCYLQAEKDNVHNTTFTSSLLIYCRERVYFAKGSSLNIKITQKEDLALFEALLSLPDDIFTTCSV